METGVFYGQKNLTVLQVFSADSEGSDICKYLYIMHNSIFIRCNSFWFNVQIVASDMPLLFITSLYLFIVIYLYGRGVCDGMWVHFKWTVLGDGTQHFLF